MHAYEEELNRLLGKLDAVESGGDVGVREARRELVRLVETEAERVERWKGAVWRSYIERAQQHASEPVGEEPYKNADGHYSEEEEEPPAQMDVDTSEVVVEERSSTAEDVPATELSSSAEPVVVLEEGTLESSAASVDITREPVVTSSEPTDSPVIDAENTPAMQINVAKPHLQEVSATEDPRVTSLSPLTVSPPDVDTPIIEEPRPETPSLSPDQPEADMEVEEVPTPPPSSPSPLVVVTPAEVEGEKTTTTSVPLTPSKDWTDSEPYVLINRDWKEVGEYDIF